ncbi:Na+/H+ antiporter NhaC family protein [Thalassotalea sp. G2M2-11]|uniref:Na+/H+ antiporter NhaC family protein n=1 Tax=Thalassotalea sp. G2M2-11 TaxID=2787627 RepID=UPI0019CF7869|nr:Na+/H+ antiporter NhaC family protein [Thalassotalea sp. G2M2-11]
MSNSSKREYGFYLTRYVSLLPLLTMMLPTIYFSTQGILSTKIMMVSGVIGLMLASLLAKDKTQYWKTTVNALGDYTGLLVFKLFLLVGIYGELLNEGQLPEGIVWLSETLALGPEFYAVFVYFVCSILGTAMGTSVGTIMVMTPVLYPTAYVIGADPALVLGAILSGAATGDHFAPVSDTTIISSSTQHYYKKNECAQVGEVVKGRLIYAIPAFLISCILYIVASFLYSNDGQTKVVIENSSNALGLIMLLPMLVVVYYAVRGKSIFEALTWGIVLALALGLGFELFTLQQLFHIKGSEPEGILITGVIKNLETIIMIILMMGAYGILKSYGLLDCLVSKLGQVFGKTTRQSELSMFGITWMFNFLFIGLVARITVIAGPIVNALGKAQNIHPVRRANILDATANSFSFFMPWHIWPMLMIITTKSLKEKYPFVELPDPAAFLTTTFYPLIIWFVVLTFIIKGVGRRFE